MSDRDTEASSSRQSVGSTEEEDLDREFFQTIRVPSLNKESIINLSITRVREVRNQCNLLNSTVNDLRQSNTDLRTSNTELRSTVIELRQSVEHSTQQSADIVNRLQTEQQMLKESIEELRAQLDVERSRTMSSSTVITQQTPTTTNPNNNTASIPTVLGQQPSTTVNQLQIGQQSMKESIEELRVQLAVERSRRVPLVLPSADLNTEENNNSNDRNNRNNSNNKALTTPVALIQQQPTTITGNSNNNNTMSAVSTPQPTTTTPIVQRPHIKASQPESFSGEKVRLVGDWLAAVKRYLMLSGVEENKWVAYAVTMLTSTALSWWNSIETSNPDRSTLDYNWNEFAELVRERFVPADSEAVAMSKMSQWKQTGSVAGYINQFQSFDQLIPSHRLDEEMRVQMFMQGLKPDCRLIVRMWEPKTLQQVYKMALKFDNNQHQSLPKFSQSNISHTSSSKFNQSNYSRLNRNPTSNQQEGTRHNPITVYNTELQQDHQSTVSEEDKEDDELNRMSGHDGQRGVCFFCKSPDHYQNTCPKLKTKRQFQPHTRSSLMWRDQSTSHSKN
jgi:Ty3 transposon capsid-like protein